MVEKINITVERVAKDHKCVVRNLMELYQHDHSEWDGAEMNEHGLYGYTYLDHYWTEEGRHPFLVRVDGKLAGFALVRTAPNTGGENRISEFFIVRKYRRKGIGRSVAHHVFDIFPGTWAVTQVEGNLPARAFWESVIANYTNDAFEQTEEYYRGERRRKQVFQSRGAQQGCDG